ncbi:MAG: toprim domain-containing protein, partial [Gemmatimonadetes bacterium]|nr:toprim domain-containing protein [Gemmatimonadota bacterium]
IGRATIHDPRTPKYRTPTRTSCQHPCEALYSPTDATTGSVAIMVEGPLDALAIASVAATARPKLTAYATGGTQPTQGQANRLLAGHHDHIVFALDGDSAGHEGTVRWVDLVCRHARQPALVADLPAGSDPADLVSELGVAALDRLTTGRPPTAQLAEIASRARPRGTWTPRQPVAGIAI